MQKSKAAQSSSYRVQVLGTCLVQMHTSHSESKARFFVAEYHLMSCVSPKLSGNSSNSNKAE